MNNLIGINRVYTEFLFTGSVTFAEKQFAFTELGLVEHTNCVSARLTLDTILWAKTGV